MKAIIIYGPPGSGKTQKLNEIAGHYNNPFFQTGKKLNFSKVAPTTDVILIDECTPNIIPYLLNFRNGFFVTKGGKTFECNALIVIATQQLPKFLPNGIVKLIKLRGVAPY